MRRQVASAITVGFGTVLIGISLQQPTTAWAANYDRGSKLGLTTQQQLKAARDKDQRTVTLLVAAVSGQTSTAASTIGSLGGKVLFREDSVGYLRVIIDTGLVEAVAALPSVKYVDMDETLPIPDPRPEGIAPLLAQPPPSSATPRVNPYMPTQDIGAAQFVNANPTYDGRGVTIGIVDTGITLDHPSLLTTSTGERKIIDWVTYTDPFTDNDPTWVDMSAQVSGATFVFNGVNYTAPAKNSYRIGLFNERDARLGGEVQSDVNRDGNPAGSSGIFAVLWNPLKNQVWVDTNQNQSFADEAAMTDYKVNYDVGYFGVDNPATPVAERMPFVVQTDGKNKVVNIGIVSAQHGSHVAGIAAGNALFGGQMTGAAPGAKIVSVRACLFIAGCTSHALIEGMIYAAKQSNVDVINMSIGGLPALNDGNNARAELYNRLIDTYNVQIFLSAGNSGPGLNTIGDPAVATRTVAVGAYVSAASHLSNYGVVTGFQHNVHYFSSRGPREDGGFKPQVLASGNAISTTPMWQPGAGLPYALPPGYSLLNGTSMASPQAAGAAALLVSAARQAGKQSQPAQLRQAMMSSAMVITEGNPDFSRIPISWQGDGLLQVGAAWDLLKTNIKTSEISGFVEVHTVLSGFLARPNVGVGIYDREGVVAGSTSTRTYYFVRTKGGSSPTTYNVSWVGDTGSFTSAATISLPLNTTVPFPVEVNAATAGEHSAIMSLDDPTTAGIDYQTMNTVIAAQVFSPGNSYSVINSGTIDRAQSESYFFRVPTGTPALQVDFSGPSSAAGTGQARFLRWHPYGVGIDSNAASTCYIPAAASGCPGSSPTSRTSTNPFPGVWEVTVDARRSSDADEAPYTLTATILGASVSPNPDVIAAATIGVPVARSYTLTNLFGPFTGRAVGTTLGSALLQSPTIVTGETQQYTVQVAAGSTSFRASINNPSDPGADLDLFVYNCTSGSCVPAGQSADGDSDESVTISNPASGSWRVDVTGYAVPSGSTTYSYVDVFVNAAFGSVSVTDANALRPAGLSWTVPGTITALAAPAAGRVLLGNVQVRTDANALIGSGDVVVQSVTP